MRKLIPILAALAAATPALAADPAPVLPADRDMAALSVAKGPRAAYLAPTATMQLVGNLETGTREHLTAEFPTDPAAFKLSWIPVGGAMSDDRTPWRHLGHIYP